MKTITKKEVHGTYTKITGHGIVATFDIETTKGTSIEVSWLIEPKVYRDLYISGRWGTSLDGWGYEYVKYRGGEYTATLLRPDWREIDFVNDRTLSSGYDDNPCAFCLRGVEIREVDIDMSTQGEYNSFRIRNYQEYTPGQRGFIKANCADSLWCAVSENKEHLIDCGVKKQIRRMRDSLGSAKKDIEKAEQELSDWINK